MTRSLAAVPSISEVEDLLNEIRRHIADTYRLLDHQDPENPGIAQAWRLADAIVRTRRGSNGGTPLADHDPVGDAATDDHRGELHDCLVQAARGLREVRNRAADVRAQVQGPVRTERRRAEMRHSQSFTHDGANEIAGEYQTRKDKAREHGRWAHEGTRP